MSKPRIAGSVVAMLVLACAVLSWSGGGILVAERLEEPATPALAVLLGGQWSDGSDLNIDQLRLKCTYFNGSSLIRKVHKVDFNQRNMLFTCPPLRNGKLIRLPILREHHISGDH